MPSIKGKKHTGGSQKRIAGSERKISGSEQSSDPDPLTRNNQMPSLPVFIDICKALKISPDYLLQDELEENEISTIREIEALWEEVSPSKQALALAMIKAALEHKE